MNYFLQNIVPLDFNKKDEPSLESTLSHTVLKVLIQQEEE